MRQFYFVAVFAFGPLILAGTVAAENSYEPLSTFKDCDQCPEMVVIPAGSFMMGSPDEEPKRDSREGPQRAVTIKKAFAIGKYEVTFDEWDACVAAAGCTGHSPPDRGWGRGLKPVIAVSWDHAQAYVQWLSELTGERYRLPSEAEWEYAARAGTTTPFATGSTITTDQANFNGTYTYNGSAEGENRQQTTPIGSFPANAFGLHDMHGNLFEFVEDCWHESYEGAPLDGSPWVSGDCDRRVQRDGAWQSRPAFLRSAVRARVQTVAWRDTFGIRVVRELGP